MNRYWVKCFERKPLGPVHLYLHLRFQMSAFLQQVFSLLTTNTGSLAYNLVLAFSIVAALLVAVSQMRSHPALQFALPFRRMLIGLSLLLLLRMVLFLSAGLAWTGLIDAGVVLPALERGVDLLSLLVIVWLWAFPQPSLTADIVTGFIALLLVTLTLFGVMAGLNRAVAQAFNGSTADQTVQLISLGLASIGILFLVIRRPPGWPTGLVMVLVLALGSLFQFLIPGDGDFPGAVRLAQMIAYPLLITLPYRFGISPVVQPALASQVVSVQGDQADSEQSGLPVEQMLRDWAQAGDPRQAVDFLASVLALDLDAEICLFLWPPDEAGNLVCQGYDRAHQLPIPNTTLEVRTLPVIAPAFRQGFPLSLPGNSTAPDLPVLASALNLRRTGSLLSVPVQIDTGQTLLLVVMLSPSSDRRWSSADQQRLAAIAIPLAHILQHNREIALVQAELAETRHSLQSAQERMSKAESDRTSLMELVSLLQPNYGDQSAAGRLDPETGQKKVPPSDLEKGDPATALPAQSTASAAEANRVVHNNGNDGDGIAHDIEHKPPPAGDE